MNGRKWIQRWARYSVDVPLNRKLMTLSARVLKSMLAPIPPSLCSSVLHDATGCVRASSSTFVPRDAPTKICGWRSSRRTYA